MAPFAREQPSMASSSGGTPRVSIRSHGPWCPPHLGFEIFLQGNRIVVLGIMRAKDERDQPSARG
jgi:hypothetical protein